MKIAKSVNRLGTEAVYNIFAETKKLIKPYQGWIFGFNLETSSKNEVSF